MRRRLSLPRLLLRLSRYRAALLFVPALASAAALGSAALAPDEYTAMARLLPPRTNTATATSMLSQIGGTETLGASALTLKSPSELYASLFLSRSVQDTVIVRFGLAERLGDNDMDNLRRFLIEHTQVEVREDGIIELKYVDDDPLQAATIVNGMIDAVYRKAQQLSKMEADNRLAFYDQIIGETRQRLVSAEIALRELESDTGYTRLKGQEEASSLTAAELESTLMARRTQLSRMMTVATDAHPSVRRMRAEIDALRASQRALGKGLEPGVVMQVGTFPDLQAKIEPARRELQIQTEVLEYLTKARQLSRVDEKRDLSNVQILDAAVPPTQKSGPRTMRNLILSVAIAFMLTLMTCLAWDMLMQDRTQRRRLMRILRPYLRAPGLTFLRLPRRGSTP